MHALTPSQSIRDYAHSVWDRGGGTLPTGVLALAQTSDGALWLGTDSGLLRFDGLRFEPWRAPPGQPLSSQYVLSLAPAPDGSLWIGTRLGLSHLSDSAVRNYQIGNSRPPLNVAGILLDSDGAVWVAAAGFGAGGLCRLDHDRLRCFSPADGLPGAAIHSLFRDPARNLWIGGLGICQWTPGPPHCYHSDNPFEIVYSIAQDQQGTLWASGRGLKRLIDGRLATVPVFPGLQPHPLLVDHDGALWIGTRGQGLFRLYRGQLDRFTHRDGLSDDTVNALLEDREGNIWVATDGGLDQFRQYAFSAISRRQGLPSGLVSSLYAGSRGDLWIGSTGGLLRHTGDSFQPYGQGAGLPSASIMGIFQEHSGRLWIQTQPGASYADAGHFHALRLPDGSPVSFAAAAEDSRRDVWFSDPRSGLVQVHDTRVAAVIPWSTFQNRKAWALEAAGDGLWLGFREGGVAWYQPGHAPQWFDTPGSGEDAAVIDLHRTPDGALWIVARESLSRLQDGHLSTLTAAHDLPCGHFQSLVEDSAGNFWISSKCGIARIPAARLAQWVRDPSTRIAARLYDDGDGVRLGSAISGYFRRAVQSADGRLWFASFGRLFMIGPRHLPENRLPPPVRIQELTADNVAVPPATAARLPARTSELRISYTAFTFNQSGKTHFRYRLDGFDSQWHDAGARREAIYTNLPPGKYTFRVIACNADGVCSLTPALSPLAIPPAYYQTVWFRLLCAAALALALWGFHRLRLRQMTARLKARFQERLAERTRIAGEMHDTLLQDLSGCALQLDGLAKNTAIPEPQRDRLREIRQETENCMREAREFVWDLRAPTLEEVDLLQALRQAAQEITSGEGVDLRVVVSGQQRPAPARYQQSLLRIVQEATRNAVRYSRASQILMDVAYEPESMRLQMRDNGCGFDLQAASRQAGHFGLTIMQERAEQIGAKIKISSAPGQGTQVDILVPMSPAS